MSSLRLALKQSLEQSTTSNAADESDGDNSKDMNSPDKQRGPGRPRKEKKKRPRPAKNDESSDENEFTDGAANVKESPDANKVSAATKIQNQFKKKKKNKKVAPSEPKEPEKEAPRAEEKAQSSSAPPPSSAKTKVERRKEKNDNIVPAPIPEILHYSRGLPLKEARSQVSAGMRVKVRFRTEVSKQDRVVHKKRWYGGRISKVSKERSKIRIRYDDGTTEVTKYPDPDIVIDEESNGAHAVDADFFLPPAAPEEVQSSSQPVVEEEPKKTEAIERPPTPEPAPPPAAPKPEPPTAVASTPKKKKKKRPEKVVQPKPQVDPEPKQTEVKTTSETAKPVRPAPTAESSSPVHESPPEEPETKPEAKLDSKSAKRKLDKPPEEGPPLKRPNIETETEAEDQAMEEAQVEETKAVETTETKPEDNNADKNVPEDTAPKPTTDKEPEDVGDVPENQAVEEKHHVAEDDEEREQPKPDVVETTVDEVRVAASVDETEKIAETNADHVPMEVDTPKSPTPSEKPQLEASAPQINTPEPPKLQEVSTPKPGFGPLVDEPVARSGRRAAQQANERIVSKQEVVIQDPSAKKKKKRGRKAESEEVEALLDTCNWVECEKCGKWRVVPTDFQADETKRWECSDNVWDPKRASCDAPEQSQKQIAKELAKERRKKKRRLQQTGVDGQGREVAGDSSDGRLTPQEPKPGVSPVPSAGGDAAGESKGVQLSAKKKGSATESGEGGDTAKGKRGRPRRTSLPVKENSTVPSNTEAENLEWVQCEKCNKWRKLPPYISSDDLPDVWTCNMNTWNPTSASCDAPEDKSDGQQELGINSSNKLSYRNLIFGSTGRNAKRPVSERTRAAESLFTADYEEGDIPTVKYANSSMFIPRTRTGLIDENSKVSVLNLLNGSRLWDELRAAAENRKVGPGNSFNKKAMYSFHNYPDDMKAAMKDMLLNALGARTLTGEEVFSDTMNRGWDNVPQGWIAAKEYCSLNAAVVALCELVKEGVLEIIHDQGPKWNFSKWVPRYRRTRLSSQQGGRTCSPLNADEPGSPVSTRCVKIAKPWKKGGTSHVE